jgi:biopolymer transport protein TolR
MAMSVGGRGRGGISEINITPMIDVLLVLLVIFMIVQQSLIRQAFVQAPPPDDGVRRAAPDPHALVLEVGPEESYRINRKPVPAGRLTEELRALFAERNRSVLFVRGGDDITYGEVAAAIDAGVQAGVEVIGLVPR